MSLLNVLLAQGVLHVAAVAAGAETQAAQFKAGLAERHLVHGRAPGGGLRTEPRTGSQQQRAGGGGGPFEETGGGSGGWSSYCLMRVEDSMDDCIMRSGRRP